MNLPMKNATLSRAADVLFQEVGGELILLHTASETYFGLNEVGAQVWATLEEATTLDALADRIEAEFDIDRQTLERDLEEVLSALAREGLITVTS
jgi:putative NIF3 family GTP cyclohydrolase 1 type 2